MYKTLARRHGIDFAVSSSLVLLGSVLCQRSLKSAWHFTIDDAGISYAYAKHIAQGLGPVAVVGGPRVEGYSDALWVFVLALFYKLGVAIPIAAKWLGVGLLAISVALGAALVHASVRTQDRRVVPVALGTLLLFASLSLEVVVWTVAGLENALFSALLLLLAYVDGKEVGAAQTGAKAVRAFLLPPWSSVVAFLVCITRPEGVMYIAPLFALKLFDVFAGKASTNDGTLHSLAAQRSLASRRSIAQQALRVLLGWAVLFGAYQLLHYAVFHDWLPNTYYAKPASRDFERGYGYLKDSLSASYLLYAIPFAGLGLLNDFRRKALLLWYCLAGTLFILYSGGDWMPHGRFLSFFALPLLTLLVMGLVQLASLLGRIKPVSFVPVSVLLAVVAAPPLWQWSEWQAPRLKALRKLNWCHFCERSEDVVALRRISRRAKLPSVTYLTHDFGGPAWESTEAFYPVDLLGLCDRNVALIRRAELKSNGKNSGDRAFLFQHLFHEQSRAPTWLHVPPNFWPDLKQSPEYVLDYFRIPRGLIPNAVNPGILGFHRGEIVDYFPEGEGAAFQAVHPKFALVALSLVPQANTPLVAALPGAHLVLDATLVARSRLSGAERFQVVIAGGHSSTESVTRELVAGVPDISPQLSPGEPFRLSFEIVLPELDQAHYDVSLRVSDADGQPTVSSVVGEISKGSTLRAAGRVLPRYPVALPAVRAPELLALRGAVTREGERERSEGFGSAVNGQLAGELLALAEQYEAQGDKEQAYLAYVWAAQVDRRLWHTLSDKLLSLRVKKADDEHAMEIELLQHYYAAGALPQLERLIGFYLARGRALEAEYFSERRIELEDAGATAVGPSAPALAFPGADFESVSLAQFSGDLTEFQSGTASARGTRGFQGEGVLRSAKRGKGVPSELLSPEFKVTGGLISLLVGGERSEAGVELLLGGKAVRDAHGRGSAQLFPELWDVSEFQGQTARLRIFDASKRGYVMLDQVSIWP